MITPYMSGTFINLPREFNYLGSGGRPVNSTAFTLDTSRDVFVSYSISTQNQITLIGGSTSTAFLEISSDGSAWTTISETSSGITGTVVIGVTITNTQIGVIAGIIPKANQVRIRSTGTTAFIIGEEVKL